MVGGNLKIMVIIIIWILIGVIITFNLIIIINMAITIQKGMFKLEKNTIIWINGNLLN
jgi:hypothetical protein